MFPSSSIVNAPTTDPNAPGSTLAIGVFLFQIPFKKKTVFKNDFKATKREKKCLIFVVYMKQFIPQALK